jgi:L-2-hydroxyglutarate oxidase LhgO
MPPGADRRYDVTVLGGGLIGLATAYRLLEAKPGLRRTTPGSLKARLSREGMEALERFAAERGIPYELCGKLVVAQ